MKLQKKITEQKFKETLEKITDAEVKSIFSDNYALDNDCYSLYEYISDNDKYLLESYEIATGKNNQNFYINDLNIKYEIKEKLTKLEYDIIMLKCSKHQKYLITELYSKIGKEYILNTKINLITDNALYELTQIFKKIKKTNIKSKTELQNFKSSIQSINYTVSILFIISLFIYPYPLSIVIIILSIILVVKGFTFQGIIYIILSVANIYFAYIYTYSNLFNYTYSQFFPIF